MSHEGTLSTIYEPKANKMKICSKCKIEKDESEFNKHKASKDGLSVWCRDCNKNAGILWNKNNPGRHIESSSRWQKENPERVRDNHTKWNDDNPNYRNNYERERRKSDLLFKLESNVRNLIGKYIRRGGYKKGTKTEQLLSCSFQTLMNHLGPQPSKDYQMDHICPCAQAKTEEELIKLQHYTNFQWLHKDDNLAKLHHKTTQAEEMCIRLLNREWINKGEVDE